MIDHMVTKNHLSPESVHIPNQIPFTSIRKYVLLGTIILLAGGVGYRLGEQGVGKNGFTAVSDQKVINTDTPVDKNVDFRLFWDVWSRMNASFIDKEKLIPSTMVEGAIRGMVASAGDPYTAFFSKKENNDFKDDMKGEFEGIGAQLGLKEGRIMVIAPLKGTPAEKAGILAGDYIIKVNTEDTSGWTIPQAVSKIRGKRGTTVDLEVFNDKDTKPRKLTISRDTINIASVESWVKPPADVAEIKGTKDSQVFESNGGRVAYLKLNRFGDNLNSDWEKGVLEVLAAQKAGPLKGLIFDLRNNPGGYLEGAVYIAGEFIPSGIVVSQKNSNGSVQNYPINRKGRLLDIPLVVLVNKGSASAAEIVAGALKDYGRAKIVGETSFGKGSVQTPLELSGGASLHVTTGKWLMPKGESISGKGITPDVIVPMESTTASADAQLAKAIELLVK